MRHAHGFRLLAPALAMVVFIPAPSAIADCLLPLPLPQFNVTGAPRKVATGDLNGDGIADIVATQDFRADIAPPPHCPGDANSDGFVNFDDITATLANWQANYTPGTGPGDADGDGAVDFDDITEVLANWGSGC